jgi:hypothetical protein
VTGDELLECLAGLRVSTRQLAQVLEVSPMWVSRRTTSQVPISDEDRVLIVEALDRIRLTRVGPPA